MEVFIKLTEAGVDTGDFSIFYEEDDSWFLLEENLTRVQMLSGISTEVPSGTGQVKVKSNGLCTNETVFNILPKLEFSFTVVCDTDTVFEYSDPAGGDSPYYYSTPITLYDTEVALQTAIDNETVVWTLGNNNTDDIPTGTAGTKWMAIKDDLGNIRINSVDYDCIAP